MSHRLLKLGTIPIVIIGLGACSASGFVSGLRWITYSQPLGEADLNEMLSSGTRMSMEWANGDSGAITYNSDGSASADVEGENIRGNWHIQDSKLCMNWNSDNSGGERCYTVYRARGKTLKIFDERGAYYAKASGSEQSS